MDDLIRREAAKAKKVYCEERREYVVPVAALDWLPSVDSAPVVHARWEQHDQFDEDANIYVCSVCGEPWVIIDGTPAENNMRYCPNCGARMDLPEGEEN